MTNHKFNYIIERLIILVKLYFISMAILFISRLIMFYSYLPSSQTISSLGYDKIKSALVLGFRVDTQVTMYGLAIPLLLILISPLLKYFGTQFKTTDKLIKFGYTLAMVVFVMLLIGNYFFYEQFKSNYNFLIFAFFDDDTKAIINVILSEYPVILTSLLIIGLIFLLNKITKYIIDNNRELKLKNSISTFLLILFLTIYFVGIRGSIGVFPLGEKDLFITNNTFINNVATNGILSFKDAIANEKYLNKIGFIIKKEDDNSGTTNNKKYLKTYLNKEEINTEDENLSTTTKKDSLLESSKPNVVFILMESFNGYYIDFHTKKFNMLGSFENHINDLIIFRNFLPKGPRTIHSLDGLIVNNPKTAPLSQSKYSNLTLSSSNIKPFHDNGYHTTFISGARMGWRNIGDYYSKQYFDDVIGYYDLSQQKEVESSEWGVHDGYMLDNIFDKLTNNKQKKPLMFFALTISNHTTYTVPSTYKPYPVEMSDSMKNVIIKNNDVAYRNFIAYQYATDKLGEFISKIKNSNLKDNTIIVATGDHTTTELFNFDNNQLLDKISVPLVMYIPEKYKKKLNIDTDMYGSHKDIFPTIFNLALSETSYMKTGENLFDKNNIDNYGVSIVDGLIICKEGAVKTSKPKVYYRWGRNKKMIEISDANKIKKLELVEKKAKAYNLSVINAIEQDIRKQLK